MTSNGANNGGCGSSSTSMNGANNGAQHGTYTTTSSRKQLISSQSLRRNSSRSMVVQELTHQPITNSQPINQINQANINNSTLTSAISPMVGSSPTRRKKPPVSILQEDPKLRSEYEATNAKLRGYFPESPKKNKKASGGVSEKNLLQASGTSYSKVVNKSAKKS